MMTRKNALPRHRGPRAVFEALSIVVTFVLTGLAFSASASSAMELVDPIDPEVVKASSPEPDFALTYSSSQGFEHNIYVFRPSQRPDDALSPALVMYHGGGWKAGKPDQFYRFARVWNQLGITVLLPVYGLEKDHGATPHQSLEDAFLSWQAIRESASELGIDPDRMAAGGGSAGGHLGAALASVKPPLSINAHVGPSALVLFNPVIDNSPEGYAADRIGPDWRSFSPLHNIGAEHPPTLFMLGDSDQLIPVSTGEAYCAEVQKAGSTCRLLIYANAEHGWFNRDGFVDTLRDSTEFLAEVFGAEPLAIHGTPKATSGE